MQITKYVLPVVVGVMSGMILIILGRNLVFDIYPLLPNTDKYDADSLAKSVKLIPDKGFILLLINNAVCSLLAGIISTLVAGRTTMIPTWVVGIIMLLAGVYDMVYLPGPQWYEIIKLFIYIPFACVGCLVVKKKKTVS